MENLRMQTQFFIKDSNNRIAEFCKSIYNNLNAEDYDVIFVSSDKTEIKAHRVVLLCSEFFKSLFGNNFDFGITKIILPNYGTEVINVLLKFLYTGEVLIPESLFQEFHAICVDFQLLSIFDINSFLKSHSTVLIDTEADEDQSHRFDELLKSPEPDEIVMGDEDLNTEIDPVCFVKIDQDDEDYSFQYAIQEIDEEQEKISDMEQEDSDSIIFEEVIEEEELPKNYPKSNLEFLPEKIKYRNENGSGPNPLYEKQLLKACRDVLENGLSYLSATRKYGIARSVIHRHVHRLKEEKNQADAKNEDFPFWEAINPDPDTSDNSKRKKYYLNHNTRAKHPEFVENLKKAVNDVMNNGASFWQAQKTYGITRSVIHRHVQKAKQAKLKVAETVEAVENIDDTEHPLPPTNLNLNMLHEELQDFKSRLQNAINSCRNEGLSVEDAASLYYIPIENLRSNLKGVVVKTE